MQMVFVRSTAQSIAVMAALGAAATLLFTGTTFKLYQVDITVGDLEVLAARLGTTFLGNTFVRI